MNFSDADFANEVNDKLGNVAVFKKILRENGLIGNRKQLTDEHIPLFKKAMEIKEREHLIWVDAFNKVIQPLKQKEHEMENHEEPEPTSWDIVRAINSLTDTLNNMNRILVKIEQKL
ncbi:hypothetical protein JQN58_01475 [Aneurinibacillus sp. BA2021]|nr:hypothetical protein [Aneurinibacillus sp. BA2021]